jgi:hypothetical protein
MTRNRCVRAASSPTAPQTSIESSGEIQVLDDTEILETARAKECLRSLCDSVTRSFDT